MVGYMYVWEHLEYCHDIINILRLLPQSRLPHQQPYHIIFSFLESYSVTSSLLSPHFATSSYLAMSSLCHIPSALTSSYVAISSLPLYSYPISILPYHLIFTIILTLPHRHTLSFHPTFFFHVIILSCCNIVIPQRASRHHRCHVNRGHHIIATWSLIIEDLYNP